MAEEWRDIEGYEGLYQVSNIGRVRSLDRTIVHQRGKRKGMKVFVKGEIKNPSIRSGYPGVSLYKGGKSSSHSVHRLVAKAFIEPVEGKEHVDHINGVKTDNRAKNLRWVTCAENTRHAFELGAHDKEAMRKRMRERVKKFGTATPPKPVIRSDGVVFESISAAARAIGACQSSVSAVLIGKNRTCKGFTFKYLEQAS